MRRRICTILLTAIVAVSMTVPAAAVTPAFYLDKVSFATVDTTAPNYTDNTPAAGNKTKVKGVSCWIENRDWGYLRLSWTHKSKAKGYQIDVCSNKQFGKVDRGATWRNTATKQLGAFESGTKYVRVRAVYKNDKVGPWSKIKTVTRK